MAAKTGRFSALDGLRGIFALVVALFHLPYTTHFSINPLMQQGYLCVDFFFVLSGFVITYAYGKRLGGIRDALDFAVRRLGRLWPLHAAMLGVLVLVEIAWVAGLGLEGIPAHAFSAHSSFGTIVSNLLLLHSLDLYPFTTWNFPSWSVSAEFLSYLLFAALCLLGRRWSLLLAGVIVAAAAATIVLASDSGMDLTYHLGAVRGALGFFTGSLLYRLYDRTGGLPRQSRLWASLLEVGMVVAVLVFVSLVHDSWPGYFAPLVFAAAVFVFAGGGGAISMGLNSRPVQYLGLVSYSIYLLHAVVIQIMTRSTFLLVHALHHGLPVSGVAMDSAAAPATDPADLWMMDIVAVIYIAVVVLLAGWTYRRIEEPGKRLFARLADRAAAPAKARPAPRPTADSHGIDATPSLPRP